MRRSRGCVATRELIRPTWAHLRIWHCQAGRPAGPLTRPSAPHLHADEGKRSKCTPRIAGRQIARLPTRRASASAKGRTRSSATGVRSGSSSEAGTIHPPLIVGLARVSLAWDSFVPRLGSAVDAFLLQDRDRGASWLASAPDFGRPAFEHRVGSQSQWTCKCLPGSRKRRRAHLEARRPGCPATFEQAFAGTAAEL